MSRKRRKCTVSEGDLKQKSIEIHTESLEDLISLLPLPPSESSKSLKFAEESSDAIVEISTSYNIESEVLFAKQISLLEKEKKELIEKQNNAMVKCKKEHERIILETQKKYDTIVNEKNNVIEKHLKSLDLKETENQRITSIKKENDKLLEKRRQELESLRKQLDSKEEENQRIMLSLSVYQRQSRLYDNRIYQISGTITHDQIKTLIQNGNHQIINRLTVDVATIKNNVVNSVREEIGEFRKEQKSFIRWLLSGVWNGFSDLCWKLKEHFMRQRLIWKIIYIFIIMCVIRAFLHQEPKRPVCHRCRVSTRFFEYY